MKIRNCFGLSTLALGLALAPNSQGASFTADLNCVLNGLNDHNCVPGPSFGTVNLLDQAADADHAYAWVKMTVNLIESEIKFFDLVLNYEGNPLLGLTTNTGGPISVSVDSLTISPYDGAFDVGFWGTGGDHVPNPWMTDIFSTSGDVSVADFLFLDTGGKLMVALHIQSIGVDGCEGNNDGSTDCVPGIDGDGSLKIGGGFEEDDDLPEVPEPSTMLLVGGSLLALAWWRNRRNS